MTAQNSSCIDNSEGGIYASNTVQTKSYWIMILICKLWLQHLLLWKKLKISLGPPWCMSWDKLLLNELIFNYCIPLVHFFSTNFSYYLKLDFNHLGFESLCQKRYVYFSKANLASRIGIDIIKGKLLAKRLFFLNYVLQTFEVKISIYTTANDLPNWCNGIYYGVLSLCIWAATIRGDKKNGTISMRRMCTN